MFGKNQAEDFMEVITRARLICPVCGNAQHVDMPVDACQFFYECVNCNVVLKPEKGDCCVFCSYANTLCPMKQLERAA